MDKLYGIGVACIGYRHFLDSSILQTGPPDRVRGLHWQTPRGVELFHGIRWLPNRHYDTTDGPDHAKRQPEAATRNGKKQKKCRSGEQELRTED